MRLSRLLLPIALPALLAAADAGAQMHKCRDAAGKITYSSQDCAEIGLKSAGEIRDKVNVSPALPSSSPARPLPPTQARPGAPDPAPKAAAADAGKTPAERRCFTVKTAKGTVTRCNDKPDEDAPK